MVVSVETSGLKMKKHRVLAMVMIGFRIHSRILGFRVLKPDWV